MSAGAGTIDIDVKASLGAILWVFPLMWLPKVKIDDGDYRRAAWFKTFSVDVPAGQHRVAVRGYGWNAPAVDVEVEVGAVVRLRYVSPRTKVGSAHLVVVSGTQYVDEVFGFLVGAKVRHDVWGVGLIRSLESNASTGSHFGVVDFENGGERRVDFDHEPLRDERTK